MRGVLAYFFLVVTSSHGARILGIFPSPSISHQLPFQAVMKAMAARGHDVTVISPDPLKTPHANYTDIDMSASYDMFRNQVDANEVGKLSPYKLYEVFAMMASASCHLQLSSEAIQSLIKSNQKFDLVYIEALMYQCMYGLIHHVGSPPMIGLLSMGANTFTYDSMGSPNYPAYFPDMSWPYTDHMSFWERANNMFYNIHSAYLRDFVMLPHQEQIMRQYFGDGPPSVFETDRNFSLIMVNSHWTMDYVKPLVPGIIQLGSLHTQRTSNALPKDLQEFLDGAKHGVVYFSLGSNVRSDKLPIHVTQQLLDAFSELPQRVLWKWESDAMPGQPKNVKLSKWLPQQDVLAHPNIRLFITQGGLQSIQEATYNEVPLLGIPFFGDQRYNVKRIVNSGVGLALDFESLSKVSLLTAVKEIVNNHSYRANMKKLSTINKDQPDTPLERAVWWSEYVLRHNGAKHLRSAALDLAWYQLLLLDVLVFILTVVVLTIIIMYFSVKKLYCVVCMLFNCKAKSSIDKILKSKRE